ncbi:MAG: ThuA domain-containing protein [Planctomycetales bacterium]|nr:ThuA domain-containing protein [Planctomycetales bacterium]
MRFGTTVLSASVMALALGAASLLSAADLPTPSADVLEKISAALPEAAPAKPKQDRHVLIFTRTKGFRHGSIPTAVAALTKLGEKTGAYTAVHSEDPAMFEPESLQKFDAVFMINTTGECLDTGDKDQHERLKQSLVDFVNSGKGLAGTHSATDTYKSWKEYNDMMGGAFAGHPWHQPVPVRLLDPKHPLNKVFGGEGFTITDEIYQFRDDTANPADRRMLLSLDPGWDGLSKGNRKDGFFPISWISKYGKGRTFYCSLGHRDEIYYNPAVLEHYLAGFQYALGDFEADATPIDVK